MKSTQWVEKQSKDERICETSKFWVLNEKMEEQWKIGEIDKKVEEPDVRPPGAASPNGKSI